MKNDGSVELPQASSEGSMHMGWEAGCQSPKPGSSLDVRVSISFLISKIGKKGLMTELRERMVIEKVWGDFPGG